jgi:hypothetical protein
LFIVKGLKIYSAKILLLFRLNKNNFYICKRILVRINPNNENSVPNICVDIDFTRRVCSKPKTRFGSNNAKGSGSYGTI